MKQYIYSNLKELKTSMRKGRHQQPMDVESETEIHKCLNCETEYKGKFCPACGQAAKVGRLSILHGINDLVGIFTNFDSGFFHTCIELVYRPGYMIRDYLNGRRKEYVKPIQLLFLLATILTLMHLVLFGKEIKPEDADLAEIANMDNSGMLQMLLMYAKEFFAWLMDNPAMMYLAIVTLCVLPNKIAFHKTEQGKKMNISEHFFVMAYMGCQMMMLTIVMMPYERLIGRENQISLSVPFLLMIWDFYQLFDLKIRKTVLLCVLSNALMIIEAILLLVIVIAATVSLAAVFQYS